MDQSFTTPMMKQYEVIKKQYQDCLLLYRMGDFYELFLEDAHIGAAVLDITLTSRAKGKDGRIPMAGVPYHAVDSYLAKLVKAGYKVAICEQMTAPNKKGIIERQVVRVVTPGTILDEKALEKKENNFIISLVIKTHVLAIAISDISTGLFQVNEVQYTNLEQTLRDELGRIHPTECILSDETYNTPELLKLLRLEHELNITCFKNWDIYASKASTHLKHHFHLQTTESFGFSDTSVAMVAAAVLLGFLQETQKGKIEHIKTITRVHENEHLLMDKSTILNLELFTTIREHDTRGTLLSILDRTETAMGGRLLRLWMRKPLFKKEAISARYDVIEELTQNRQLKEQLYQQLECIADIERMLSRLSVGIGNARDLTNLKSSLKHILIARSHLEKASSKLLKTLHKNISKKLEEIVQSIEQIIVDEPPISIREGKMIKVGIHKRLDMLRDLVGGGKEWIAKLEIEERKNTGIGSLKVRFNKVFGFYIEISKANVHLVPKHYMRKQTLVNGERFITPDLKKQEEIILSAEEEINDLEYELFQKTLTKVLSYTEDIQKASQVIATIDCLMSFTELAEKNHYIRPTLDQSGSISIIQGRHPVVETLLTDTQFVPNNVSLDSNDQQLLIITGPNMAGKSVFIRQTALIVFMAQIGCFVPAEQATISLIDRIFVRSGASDVITSGLSTFMVEMVETAYILNHATEKSLIIMDEIGRGTSTYDGISIAWAVAEYLVTHEKTPAKTLFATHYHELQELAQQYPHKIHNFHMAVVEEHGSPIFLHTLLPGGASASFGVAVAKLAGVPEEVIQKAKILLTAMEKKMTHTSIQSLDTQTTVENDNILEQIKSFDLYKMTPLEALNTLAKLQEKLQK